MNKAQYFQFTKKICDGKAPSIKEAANEVGATIPALKKFMKKFFEEDEKEEEDLFGNKSKGNPHLEIFRMMQSRASQHAADLLVRGKITEKQALKYLSDNGHDASRLESLREHAEKMKNAYDRYNEYKEKREKAIED